MTQLYQQLLQNKSLLAGAGLFSIVTFVVSVWLLPVLVLRIPPDYFAHQGHRPDLWHQQHKVLRLMFHVAKNLLGLLLILLGFALLVLPGQGLLTLFLGVLMLDFPGKYQVEQRLIGWPPILRSVNWLRQKYGKDPIVVPD